MNDNATKPAVTFNYPDELVRPPEPPDGARLEHNVYVTMRDDVRLAVRKLLTVSSFVSQARFLVRCMERVDSPGRLYHFTRVSPPARRSGAGAAHGFEIPYLFGLDALPRAIRLDETNLRQVYEALLADDLNADGVLDSSRKEVEVSLTGETVADELFMGLDEVDLFLRGKALRELLEELAGEGAI